MSLTCRVCKSNRNAKGGLFPSKEAMHQHEQSHFQRVPSHKQEEYKILREQLEDEDAVEFQLQFLKHDEDKEEARLRFLNLVQESRVIKAQKEEEASIRKLKNDEDNRLRKLKYDEEAAIRKLKNDEYNRVRKLKKEEKSNEDKERRLMAADDDVYSHKKYSNSGLPFSKVSQISWDNLEIFQKQSSECLVSWKADGKRCLIHCDLNSNCYAMYEIKQYCVEVANKKIGVAKNHFGFVLDAEMIQSACGETLFLCFNLLHSQLNSVGFDLDCSQVMEVFVKELQLPHVIFKPWYNIAHCQQLLNFPPPFPTDGLVFSALSKSNQFTWKWKPVVTVDFLLGPGPIDKQGRTSYLLYTKKMDQNCEPDRYDAVCYPDLFAARDSSCSLIQFFSSKSVDDEKDYSDDATSESSSPIRHDSRKNKNERHPDRIDHELFVNTQFPSILNFDDNEIRPCIAGANKIVEVKWNADTKTWKFVRIRYDRLSAECTRALPELLNLIMLPMSTEGVLGFQNITCEEVNLFNFFQSETFEYFFQQEEEDGDLYHDEDDDDDDDDDEEEEDNDDLRCDILSQQLPHAIVMHVLSFLQIPEICIFSSSSVGCWHFAQSMRLLDNRSQYLECLTIVDTTSMNKTLARIFSQTQPKRSFPSHSIIQKDEVFAATMKRKKRLMRSPTHFMDSSIHPSCHFSTYIPPRRDSSTHSSMHSSSSMLMQILGIYYFSDFRLYLQQLCLDTAIVATDPYSFCDSDSDSDHDRIAGDSDSDDGARRYGGYRYGSHGGYDSGGYGDGYDGSYDGSYGGGCGGYHS